jgi:putative sterol carrier protein
MNLYTFNTKNQQKNMTAKEFLSTIPSKVNSDENKELNTALHFDLNEEQYTISVKAGVAELLDGLVGEPEITLKAKPDDFVKIASGDMNPMTAMMFGKLKVSNPGAMMKYAKLLGFM